MKGCTVKRGKADTGKGHITWDEMLACVQEHEEWDRAHPVRTRVREQYYAARRMWMYNLRPRMIYRQSKWAWQRSRRGWSDSDTWSFDNYVCTVVSDGLDYLAEHTHGYPGEGTQWETFEDWQAYLHDLADRIRTWNKTDDSVLNDEAYEISKKAMEEFGRNLGLFWD